MKASLRWIGCVLLAVSYVVIAYAAWQGGAGKISWLWLLLYFVIITTGEIYSSPISQSLYSKVAPLRIASLMIAVNFLPNFLGGGLMQGWLGTFWEDMSHPAFDLKNPNKVRAVIGAFAFTRRPFSASTRTTRPARSDLISLKSFIASMRPIGCPTATTLPTATSGSSPGERAA